MAVKRYGVQNPSANTEVTLLTTNDPLLISVIITNKHASADAEIRVFVIPNGVTNPSQYSYIAYDLPVNPGNSVETHRFAVNAGDTVKVSSNITDVSFTGMGIPQTDVLPADEVQVFTNKTINGLNNTLTNLPAANLTGTLPSSVLGNSTVYVGTTAVSLNRASSSLSLTGISIDGNAGTVTNGVYTTGYYSDPSWLIISKSKVGLGNVENTTLSTWTGSTNINTLGTISSGTWNGNSISTTYTDAKVISVNGSTGTVTGLATTTALATHESDTTNVHGIVNTANLLDKPDDDQIILAAQVFG